MAKRVLKNGVVAVPVRCIRRTTWFMNHQHLVPEALAVPEPWRHEWPGVELIFNEQPVGAAGKVWDAYRAERREMGEGVFLPWPFNPNAARRIQNVEGRGWLAFDLDRIYEGGTLHGVAGKILTWETDLAYAHERLAYWMAKPADPHDDRTRMYHIHNYYGLIHGDSVTVPELDLREAGPEGDDLLALEGLR